MKRSILALTCLLSLFVLLVPSVQAQVVLPSFPSCVSPVGVLKADNNGTHGIAGETIQFVGNDKVYTITDSTLMQCFCPENGTGIQTNWVKVTGLTQDEIDDFRVQGWIFIPDGNAWGLEASSYLARNVSYNCRGGTEGLGGQGGGEVLGASNGVGGAVLGLAATGTTGLLVALLIGGIGLTGAGVYLRRNEI